MVFDLNLVIGLVLGFLLGWLVEWLMDRAYWRQGDERASHQVMLLEAELGRLQAELDTMRLKLRDLSHLRNRLEQAQAEIERLRAQRLRAGEET
ncbi:conserved hypothetical protein [Allomeiothermus silvanus DSM 9946]|uniref:Uncharacterized protein n=1 Tax=Allomeiothermus silvanus (strain ATCC 700542 / DSM 9946 / NBRC 106475 / NCIMB 13440 / VI-R2) TaxID=526227 RepID=D7BED8_ALLS1|nr:hypothetical protein [Allomeiothermus silvanus]ADH63181.1 conserved hypothetical protein [Allomeiothermus silvanus DSM 9946]